MFVSQRQSHRQGWYYTNNSDKTLHVERVIKFLTRPETGKHEHDYQQHIRLPTSLALSHTREFIVVYLCT